MGRAGRPGLTGLGPPWPSCLHPSRGVPSLLDPSPFCMWVLIVSFSPSWTKLLVPQDSALFRLGPWSLSSSRVRSMGFLESSLLHCMTCTGLQGLVKVLVELIPEVLLSTSKPCINTKLQNRHARMKLVISRRLVPMDKI
jgi:hypothetical protein